MTRKLSKKCALCGSNKTTPLERGVKDPVSLEVFADDYKNVKKQALLINKWGKNVHSGP